MSNPCNCGLEDRLETYDTPGGAIVTRCQECGAQIVEGSPPAAAPGGGDPWAQALAGHVAGTAPETPEPDDTATAELWPDIGDLSVPKITDRLVAIEDDAERQAMAEKVVAWELTQPTPRVGVTALAPKQEG